MKNYIFLWITLLGISLWSCKDDKDDNELKGPLEIVISGPSAGATFNLAEDKDLSFGWIDVAGITGYKLVISLSESLSLPQTVAADSNPLTISAKDFDKMAGGLNIGGGETKTVYWSIQPLKSSQVAKTGKGTIIITRKPFPVIILPEQTSLTIDAGNYTSHSFGWTPVPEITAYTVKFSKSADKFNSTGDYVSFAIPEGTNTFEFASVDNFDDMLKGFGMDYNESQTIYWTVEPTVPTTEIVTQTRYFTGKRKKAEIVLPAQADLTIDVGNYTAQSFTWAPVAGIMEYTIKFSKEPDKFNVDGKYVSFNAVYKAEKYDFATAESFDELLASLGLCYGESQTIYWTVEPTVPSDGVLSQTRHFTGQRKTFSGALTIGLTAPATGVTISVNTGTFPYVFGWTGISVSPNYRLKFSKDIQFPASATVTKTVNGSSSYSLTKSEFEQIVATLGPGVLYWTVVPTNDPCGKTTSGVNSFTAIRMAHYMVTGFDTQFTQSAANDPKYLWDNEWSKTYAGGNTTSPWANDVGYRNFSSGFTNGVMGTATEANPCWITFELGYPIKLSQYKHHYYYPFFGNCPLYWELWAYTGEGAPTAAEKWDNWVKIGEGNSNSLPTRGDADQSARIAAYPIGETLTFDKNTVPKARYYRFKCVENWQWKNGEVTDARRANFSLGEILCWPFDE